MTKRTYRVTLRVYFTVIVGAADIHAAELYAHKLARQTFTTERAEDIDIEIYESQALPEDS